jgi:hypothetical protein
MSILVVMIKNEQNLSILKQIIGVFKEKVSVISDEEFSDRQFAALIEEEKDSEVVPEEAIKKEFSKHGIKY